MSTRKAQLLRRAAGNERSRAVAITREEKALRAVLEKAGVGGSSVQPDWNQNDPNAPDYVKNRPFYIDYYNTTAIKEQTVQITKDADDLVGYAELSVTSAQIVAGLLYEVTLNGTVYCCVPWWHDGWGAMVLGNGSFADKEGMGEDVPFIIDFYPEDDEAYLNAEDGEYTISIEGYLDSKKIDIDCLGTIVIKYEHNPGAEDLYVSPYAYQRLCSAFDSGEVIRIPVYAKYIGDPTLGHNETTFGFAERVVFNQVNPDDGKYIKIEAGGRLYHIYENGHTWTAWI